MRLSSPVREFDIGYIMGLVVGEGSFTADRRQPYLQVKTRVRDPFPAPPRGRPLRRAGLWSVSPIRPGTTTSGCSVVKGSRLQFPYFARTCPRAGSASNLSGGWISTQSSSLWIGALPPHPSLSATPNVRGV